jgi:FkbM family methyltransferase
MSNLGEYRKVHWAGLDFNVSSGSQGFYGQDFWESDYEKNQIRIFSHCVDLFQNYVFVDCGAAIGAYTLPAASKGIKVIAFEPERKVFDVLESNLEANNFFNGNVKSVYSALVSKKDRKRKFGGNAKNVFPHEFSESETIFAETIKNLDNLIIKMDIEGAEWPILQDKNTLKLLLDSNSLFFLAIHVGFHSDKRNSSFISKFKFRIGVIHELITFIKLCLKFKYVHEINSGNLTITSFLRKRMFSARAWPNTFIFSNSNEVIKKLAEINLT